MASWIVKKLIDQGHVVHATVRDLEARDRIEHLLLLQKDSPEQLKLFESDLLKEGSFDTAMEDCEIVIHTASPYFLSKPKDIQEELVKPAVQGTRNVLNSVNAHRSVKRVVLTSSVVALFNDAKDLARRPGNIVNEQDVNSNQDITHNPYAYSKTQAEQAAWSMQEDQNRWDLITIHPGAIFGPSLSKRSDATSIDMMIQFLNGSYRAGVPRLWLGVVDVRDVAQAHISATLNRQASKKYIVMGQTRSLLEIAGLINVAHLGLTNKLPRIELPKILVWLVAPFVGLQRRYVANNVNYPIDFDNDRSKTDLGLKYYSAGKTLNEHAGQLVADKMV